MPSYGPACRGCSGEDCQCCSTYLENLADQRAEQYNHDDDDFDDSEDYCEKCGHEFCICGDEGEILEADELPFDENCESDTPMGEQYDDMTPEFDG